MAPRPKLTDFVLPSAEKEPPAAAPLIVPGGPPPAAERDVVVPMQAPPPVKSRRRKMVRGVAGDGRIGQTLRLSPEAWEQLRVIAARERLSAHDLQIEGINAVFRRRGLPEIA